MANFCSNCAAALETDARFCPSCSAPVGVSSALASELRSNVQSSVRSLVSSPSMKVQKPIWAGVIEAFWSFMSIGWVFSGIAVGGLAALTGVLGQQGVGERFAVWFMLTSLYNLALLSFHVPLTFGFFMQKRWAYGLFLWSIGPLVLAGLILKIAAPSVEDLGNKSPLSLSMLSTFGWLLSLGLAALQVFLVLRSKDELVN